MQFKEVTSPFLEGVFMQCTKCSATMDPDATGSHSCPPTEEQLIESQMEELRAVICDDTKSFEERDKAMQTRMGLEDQLFEKRMKRIEQRFTPEVLRPLILKEFDAQITFARKQVEKEYEENDKRRREGVTFAERQAKLNRERIRFMERQEDRLVRDQRCFVVRPVHEWFDKEDYAIAKKRGMSWIIRTKFGSVYTIPQDNNGKRTK